MADLTITPTAEADGRVRYDLGRANWGAPIPDLRTAGATISLDPAEWIDVVILGDGYQTEPDFRARLGDWIKAFFTIRVYDLFAGAFRIRALHTPSAAEASTARTSFYRVKTTDDNNGVSKDDWETLASGDNDVFRRMVWASVDSFGDVHQQRYPTTLDVGTGHSIANEHIRDTYRNLVVSMLVRTAGSPNVSGMTSNVRRDLSATPNSRVAFGANSIHEFSHAFGFLSDEYIDGRGRANH